MAVTLDPKVDEKLRGIVSKRAELARQLSEPSVVSDLAVYRTLSRQYSQLGPIVETYEIFRKTADECRSARELLAAADDAEMKAMAQDEIKTLEATLTSLGA